MDEPPQALQVPPQDVREQPPADTGDLPSTGPLTPPTGLSFEVCTPVADVDTRVSWPRPVTGRIGPYVLLEEIARGGMGIVYKARDTRLGRTVALKTMRSDALNRPENVQRFQREMEAAARLSHPNIVPIHDVGTHEGQPYYTMDYLAAGTLAGQRTRLLGDARAVAAVMEKVARGVQHAHEREVFHRDLKPGNVLVDERGEPHVSDFGLAKFRDGDLELTQTGAVVGTVPYMAPEQAAGRGKEIGPSADVWALGVMLYELLTGRRPFTGDSSEEVRRKILVDEPPRLRRLQPGLGRDLEAILFKCLEKDPARRYRSAGALADDLHRYLEGAPVGPASPTARMVRAARRHAWRVALAAGVIVAAAAALLYREHADPDRPLREYQRQWAAGKPLTLVDGRGYSPWHRWVFLPGQLHEDPRQDYLVLKSMEDLSLLELLPAPPPEGYRLRARVRHAELGGDNAETGKVGLYFARSESSGAHGTSQALCTLWFSDRAVRNNCVELDVWHWVNADSKHNALLRAWVFDPSLVALTVGLTAAPARAGPLVATSALFPGRMPGLFPGRETWHELAVEVSPGRLRAFWMGAPLGEVTLDTLGPDFESLRNPPIFGPVPDPDFHPRFAPGDALGLCTGRGTAYFRDVVVEPLNAQP